MDIGEALRIAREQRGLSLETISQRTKIGVLALRAIEENDVQRLPGGIFLRGFVRAYAREVGLDVEDTVSRYVAQFESQPVVEGAVADADTLDSSVGNGETRSLEGSVREMSVLGLVAIIVLSVGVLTYMTLRQFLTKSEPTIARAAAPPVAAVAPTPAGSAPAAPAAAATATTAASSQALSEIASASTPGETGTAGSHEPPASPATPVQGGNVLTLAIETTGPCWVSAIVDGETVVYRLMQEGERQSIPDGNDVVLRVGDPATFTFSLNGAPGRSLGAAGTAATVHITPDNYREFIGTAPTP
jgi:cytoskeleton protein RodZ